MNRILCHQCFFSEGTFPMAHDRLNIICVDRSGSIDYPPGERNSLYDELTTKTASIIEHFVAVDTS